MELEISEELFWNVIKDFEKKELTANEKGAFINQYLKQSNLSQRGLAKKLGIPHSTIHDWCTNRQMIKYYDKKNHELDTLLDRTLFVLTRKEYEITDKTSKLIKELKEVLDTIETK